MAGNSDEQQWPPRSPYEAALISPSGRKKLQQRQQQREVSPSPIKRRTASGSHLQVPLPPSDDEEDEETMQLQLQALEAKLKLKRLQNKKAKEQATGVSESSTLLRAPSVLSSQRDATRSVPALYKSKSTGNIQVPLSPERKPTIQHEPKSPGRVLLGIDKGLNARDVSLRKAPSPRKAASIADPFISKGSTLTRNGGVSIRNLSNGENAAPLSFNERMAQAKDREKLEKQRQDRMDKLGADRSTGFKIRKEEIAAFKDASESAPRPAKSNARATEERALSREDILRAANKPAGGLLQRSSTTSALMSGRMSRAQSTINSRPGTSASNMPTPQERTRGSNSLSDDSRPTTPDATLFEGFSRTNLSSRILPHSYVARQVEDKIPATLPMLLKEVKAPDFILPPHLEEKDLVVFATIAAKSEPRWHKQTQTSKTNAIKTAEEEAAESAANENGKYIIFTLTDLKWSVELYLFQSAYTRWHKLQPGTVVAILNPQIMPPPKNRTATNRWSFTLNSADDTVLEIGTSKDLGWCKAKTKEGKDCSDWVDTRKTEFCDYHVNRSVEGLRSSRMETQGMSMPWGPGGKSSSRNGYGRRQGSDDAFGSNKQSNFYVVSRNTSTASLLDSEDSDLHGSKEERQRRLFALQEKEREIARALSRDMPGPGADYLRIRNGENKPARPSTTIEASDSDAAKSLGLRNNAATNVMLSPLKRKPSIRATSGSGTEREPKRKKTRFITEKGIREAGRDSLGADGLGMSLLGKGNGDDDDDGLDIV